MKELLEKRRELKSKKPTFHAQDAHKKKEVPKKWKRPRGLQSKMRLSKRGYPRCVSVGWSSPAAVRGLDRSGLKPIIVSNVSDLSKLTKETDGAVISATVGAKKKITILEKAAELSITVLNVKDASEFKKSVEEMIIENKKQRAERTKKKESKKPAEKKKDKKEESLADKVEKTEEEKTMAEKKEKDKLLTKREMQ